MRSLLTCAALVALSFTFNAWASETQAAPVTKPAPVEKPVNVEPPPPGTKFPGCDSDEDCPNCKAAALAKYSDIGAAVKVVQAKFVELKARADAPAAKPVDAKATDAKPVETKFDTGACCGGK